MVHHVTHRLSVSLNSFESWPSLVICLGAVGLVSTLASAILLATCEPLTERGTIKYSDKVKALNFCARWSVISMIVGLIFKLGSQSL